MKADMVNNTFKGQLKLPKAINRSLKLKIMCILSMPSVCVQICTKYGTRVQCRKHSLSLLEKAKRASGLEVFCSTI
jgi:hypothetical protein